MGVGPGSVADRNVDPLGNAELPTQQRHDLVFTKVGVDDLVVRGIDDFVRLPALVVGGVQCHAISEAVGQAIANHRGGELGCPEGRRLEPESEVLGPHGSSLGDGMVVAMGVLLASLLTSTATRLET
jgi:hypothetical protein